MSRWQNFSIWRGRLPHWRADEVTYFVTFRYRRNLNEKERNLLFRALMRPEGRKLDLHALLVGEEHTDLIFQVMEAPTGRPFELSEIIEKAKLKAGRQIVKLTGERMSPFYGESFDRILRDEAEYEERWQALFNAATENESNEDFLYLREKPD